jgi:hypothetical protein
MRSPRRAESYGTSRISISIRDLPTGWSCT